MKKILIQFEKNNIINKKIVVTVIWLFSLVTLVLLIAITYQELISEQLQDSWTVVEALGGVGIGILLISGLLSKSKTARWIILLISYIVLLTPFVTYFMLYLFIPQVHEDFWAMFIIPNLIMSIFIITLLSNRISLKLYSLKKTRKARIKEQVYLCTLAIICIAFYTYYVYIPLLFKSIY